jgi:hypothetical protein
MQIRYETLAIIYFVGFFVVRLANVTLAEYVINRVIYHYHSVKGK